jgi:hypothetical protein
MKIFFFCLITIRINSFVFGYVGMYRLDSKRLTMCDQDLPPDIVNSLRDNIKLLLFIFFCSISERNVDKNSKDFTTA